MSYSVYKFQPETGEFSACCDANAYSFDQEIFDSLKERYFEEHPQLIKRKKDLIKNIKNSDCVQCWKKEEQGLKSMRMDLGPCYKTLWNNFNLNTSSAYPERIELWMNSTCNLGCFMCHIGNSNTLRKIWYTDFDTYGNSGKGFEIWTSNSLYNHKQKEMFVQAMIDFIIKYVKNVNIDNLTIAYLGGEPTLHSEMYDHADIFIEAGKQAIKSGKKLTIEFTTNGTSKDKLNDRFYKMFEKYKIAGWTVCMRLSQDGAGDYAQVRHGSDFSQIKKNFENWIHPDSCVDEISSFTVLSNINLPYIDHMAEYINESVRKNYKDTKKLSIHFNALISPQWMQVKYIPKKYIDAPSKKAHKLFLRIKKDYNQIVYNRSLFQNIINSVNETVTQKDANYFFNKIMYVNRVYKKTYPSWDFLNTFPHLVEYANECGIEI